MGCIVAKLSRDKGARGEREICAILSDELGISSKRNLDQTREGGCDITAGPFNLEVKRRAKIGNIYDWMEQAAASCEDTSQKPVVLCHADGKKWLVIMPLQDFITLSREEIAAHERS